MTTSPQRPESGPKPAAAPGDAPRFTLAVLLQHAGKLLDDRQRRGLDELGLHPSQGQVLRLLSDRDGIVQGDLTRAMRIAAPTVSGILKRMEAANLVERRPDADDERVTRVYLTRKGRALGRAARDAVDAVERELIADLSRGELRSAHSVLRKLRNNLGGLPPGDEPPISRVVP